MDLNEREKMFLNAAVTGEPTELKPITRVERFLYQIAQNIGSGGGGGVSSWNDLKDKPFGEVMGDTLYFDGNTDGLVDIGGMFYKVSDVVLTMDDLANGGTYTQSNFGDEIFELNEPNEISGGVISIHGSDVVSVSESAVGTTIEGMEIKESGIYFYGGSIYVSSITINGFKGFPMVKKVDEKYLPEIPDGLPEVTEEDNGKVLGVENGVWSVVEQSGGSGGSDEATITKVSTDNVPSAFTSGMVNVSFTECGIITVMLYLKIASATSSLNVNIQTNPVSDEIAQKLNDFLNAKANVGEWMFMKACGVSTKGHVFWFRPYVSSDNKITVNVKAPSTMSFEAGEELTAMLAF